MNSRLLAFAGHKQAGKTTSCNFLHGYQLRACGIVDGFDITEDGGLVVKSKIQDENGQQNEGFGMLDTSRNDPEFAEWAAYNMWPFIKRYSFAGPLKEISTKLFGLSSEVVYGSDIQKNTHTFFRWEDMPGVVTKKDRHTKKLIEEGVVKYHTPGKMTHREFLQFFGTDVCRKIYDEIWFTKLLKDVSTEEPLIAIVDDCRFINEVEAIRGAGGKVIYLTRTPHKDSHSSESELDGYNDFDLVVDNQSLSIHETNLAIIEALNSWGWLESEVVKNDNQENQQKDLVGGIHKIKG